MKSKNKLLALLLCMIFIVSMLLVSCKDETPNESNTNSNAQSNTESKDVSEETSDPEGDKGYLGNGVWGREMPEFKWDYKQFRVIVYSRDKQATYFSEEIEADLYETTDEKINEAVKRRNDQIFDKYNVEIKAVLVDDVIATIREQLAAADPDNADAAMPFFGSTPGMAQEGNFYNLKDFEKGGYIDLSMPWWDQNANSSLSINNKLYFTTGDMSIMQKIVSTSILFNPDMLAKTHPEINLYQEVRDYKWTMDRYFSLAKEHTFTNGNPDDPMGENWGISGSSGDINAYYIATGNSLVKKDNNDLPMFTMNNTEEINAAQKVIDQHAVVSDWGIFAQSLPADIWVNSLKIFGDGNALFRPSAYSAVKKLRDYELKYGVLPYPLLNEEQDSYYTPCSAYYAYAVTIPLSARDPEFSAFMLDVICAGSRGDLGLATAYYEATLKLKDVADSTEMLDNYIFNNVVYDLGIIYNFGGVSTLLSGVVADSTKQLTSTIDANKDAIDAAIQKVIEDYDN
ncbi:hypothetical protein LJB90_04165 [Eubacteriales bacterium OttesenSCG-928-G02]|nr:hypothetical protein [Eubacteriales bacterium OttesenSCG-928-G02]